MQESKLDRIYFPKFEFDTKYFMEENLKNLGIKKAFTGNADFSGMTEAEQLYISSVIHQAYVKVDEKGTEAAAATAVFMGATARMPSKIFKADHPFIFIIQEKKTGEILFVGKVVNPNE
jgi:serpin B